MAQLRDLIVTGAARFVNGAYFGGASTFGSATRPVWWNNGFPQATTYSLSATLNAGSANRLAYYSGANAVSASSHYASATQVGINITNIDTIGSRALYVNGTSQFSDDIYANKSIRNLAVGGGLYWNPYVESATDSSDAASITLIKSGIAGGTELQIKQANDQNDVINLVAPYYIYLNSKRAFTVNDSWLRINDTSTFTSGIYTGTSILRTDNQLQVGNNGANFYVKNTGDAFIQKTLGIAGVNIGYALYVNGKANIGDETAATSASTGALTVSGGIGVSAASWFGNTVTATRFIGPLQGTADNATALQGWLPSHFYNEYFGNRWYHIHMNNTSNDRTGFYKVADIIMTSGYGSYTAAKIVGYLYDHNGNWEQTETHIMPFECIINITNDSAQLFSNVLANSDHLRIVKIATRTYELQARCNATHTDFDVFFQVVGGSGVTPYETLVTGSSSGTIIGITQMQSHGNYAYRSLILANARSFTIGNTSRNFNGSSNVSWTIAEIGAVNKAGDTMTGALNFANGTWNKAGDDAQFGDNNTAGSFAIQGINGNTNLKMVTYGANTYGTITWNGSQFVFSNTITGTLNGNAATATALTTSAGNAGQPVYFSSGKPVAIDWRIGNSGVGEHNANNVTYNFCGYYTSNGPATSLGASTNDGALYAQAYNSTWVGQIAQDYRNGGLYVRGKNNGTWQSWYKVLDTRNYTGVLDGRYVNVTGDTMTGTLSIVPPYQATAASRFHTSALEIREAGGVTSAKSDIGYAPRIGFHWGGRVAASLAFHSNGAFYFRNQADNGNAPVYASTFYGTLSGNASSATYSQYISNPRNSNTNMNTLKFGTGTLYSREDSGSSVSNLPNTQWWQTICQRSPDGNYANQLAQQMTGGTSAYIRSFQGGTWSAWYRLWRQGDAVTGAVWNDYAECRQAETEEAGYVLYETGKDDLKKTTERLQHFAGVSSDTWGFSQGETEKAKTPIAVAGRVLVYPYQDRNNYQPGDCVCAAPGGTVDIMTREEVVQYPDRIVGTVSCVPDYEEWGGGEGADRDPVKVNGRIWIKVK